MALRATTTARPPHSHPVPPPSVPPTKTSIRTTDLSISKPQSKPSSLLLSATTALPLFAPFAVPLEARAVALPKEQIVSSIDQVESTIDQVVEVGSNFFSVTGQVIGAVVKAVKPGVDATLPILKQAGEEAVKIASPVVSQASRKAQEVIESSGIDTQPVKTVAKTVVDAAQQTTQVIVKAKPVAVSTAETILSAEPSVILGTGGVLVLAYFLLPPIFSAISFRFRGYQGDMDLRAILARQAAKDKATSSRVARTPPRCEAAVPVLPVQPEFTPSSGSAATPQDPAAVSRKRKEPMPIGPEVVVLPSSKTLGDETALGKEQSSGRSPPSPPRFPAEYTAETNLFTSGPTSLGFRILHSLGSAAEQQHLASTKLKPCTLEGCNELVRGVMKIMNGLDRTALLRNEALNEAEEARGRVQTLSRELAEFKEVHSATIDSLKAECDRVRGRLEEQQQQLVAARAEAQSSRAELEIYKNSEADRHQAFLKSKEFQEILGPKAFKFLKIGFQSCRDQYAEAGLAPENAADDFPDIGKAIASVPDDVLEDAPEDEDQEAEENEAENQEAEQGGDGAPVV